MSQTTNKNCRNTTTFIKNLKKFRAQDEHDVIAFEALALGRVFTVTGAMQQEVEQRVEAVKLLLEIIVYS